MIVFPGVAQQIVGRERRERVSHHDWSGDAFLNSRRRVNSAVGRPQMKMVEEREKRTTETSNGNQIEFLKQVADHFKHLTTLSSGFILVMATMIDKVFHGPKWRILMAASFFFFVVSIVASLMAQAYCIDHIKDPQDLPEKPTSNLTVGSMLSAWASFVVGVLALIIFAIRNFL